MSCAQPLVEFFSAVKTLNASRPFFLPPVTQRDKVVRPKISEVRLITSELSGNHRPVVTSIMSQQHLSSDLLTLSYLSLHINTIEHPLPMRTLLPVM